MDLFLFREKYPDAPGFKARKTAHDAAVSIKPRAPTLRAVALDTIAASPGMTADEVASAMGCSILSVRPRVAELATTGKIKDSGDTRVNASGKAAIVWVAA